MSKAEQTQTVAMGTQVIFKWSGLHDVWLLPNKAAYDACDFSQGKELASTNVNKYTYETLATGTFYFACKVTGHCKSAAMKMVLTVPPPSGPAPTYTNRIVVYLYKYSTHVPRTNANIARVVYLSQQTNRHIYTVCWRLWICFARRFHYMVGYMDIRNR